MVMPVFNESAVIERVIGEWCQALGGLGIDFRICAYDDGSTDDTGRILERLAGVNRRLQVRRHQNRGHGPTVLRGYRENAACEWIFQVDSDDEVDARAFPDLWARRNGYALLVGERARRARVPSRRAVSVGARFLVEVLFGGGVRDVNSPYRLLRAEDFSELFFRIPEATFSPNLLITGWAASHDLRTFTSEIGYRPRRTGEVSIRRWGLVAAAARSVVETAAFWWSNGTGARERGLGSGSLGRLAQGDAGERVAGPARRYV